MRIEQQEENHIVYVEDKNNNYYKHPGDKKNCSLCEDLKKEINLKEMNAVRKEYGYTELSSITKRKED
jgi:hypothetical protein